MALPGWSHTWPLQNSPVGSTLPSPACAHFHTFSVPRSSLCRAKMPPKSLFFFFLNFWLCWVFAAVCSGLSLVAVSESCSVVAVGERLISVASLVAEHGLEAAVVAAPGL